MTSVTGTSNKENSKNTGNTSTNTGNKKFQVGNSSLYGKVFEINS
jgi:hypothetical protein